MPRSGLTQNYTRDEGTLFRDFEDVSGWSKFGNGTIEDDSVNFITGSKSMKITITSPGGYCTATKTFSAIDLRNASRQMSIWVYCHDSTPGDTISSFILYLYSATGIYYQWTYSGLGLPGWNHLIPTRNAWSQVSNPDWSHIIKMQVRLAGTGGQMPSISVDSFYYGVDQRDGRIIISFDDGNDTDYTEAYAYMSQYGFKGTCFIIPTRIGNTGYMTQGQLDTLYGAGWALANHSYTHEGDPFLAGRTQAYVEDELLQCKSWLDARGYTRASRHVAYPAGAYDDNVLAAMASTGMLTGRLVGVSRFDVPPANMYLLKPASPKTIGLAAAKSMVDLSVDYGKTIYFYGHSIGAGAWEQSEFRALMDYINERRGNVVTIDEWYEGLTNPRYTSGPLVRAAR